MHVLTQSVAGAVAGELLSVIKNVAEKSYWCKYYCQRLEKTLERSIPILDEIFGTGLELSQHRQRTLVEFHDKLLKGIELIENCSKVSRLNVYQRYKYAKRILDLEKYISNFFQEQGWANTFLEVHHTRQDVMRGLENIEQKVERNDIATWVQQPINDFQIGITAEAPYSRLQIPELPEFHIGLKISVEKLKTRLFQEDVSVVGLTGIGGSGKTTLSIALCRDLEVQEYFKGKIIFETVSQSPNIKGILERMWDKIVGKHRPDFLSVEDAHMHLQQSLCMMQPQPTLVLLDDIWSRTHLENLLFKAAGYKTLVTTRHNFIVDSTCQYDLQLLREADALSLFCFWTFEQPSIPETADENLVRQVVAECKGLPLALKVIGRSLCDQPPAVWISSRNKLSRSESISDYHKDGLFKCLATSIDVLDDEVRQCFLDLGSFPEDKRISVDALLDMWVHVHGLEWHAAYVTLIELASRNLLSLVNNPMSYPGNSYGSSCELSFLQHDVLRDLALYLTNKKQINKRKRLIMPRKENYIPAKWRKYTDHPFDAQIVSIHTGSMNEEHWCQMDFPEAKALILNFAASEYFLPSFMQTMHKLQVLIIVNHNSNRATLKGLTAFYSLAQLKSVQLERVIVPPLREHCISLQTLEKLSLILCEVHGNTSGVHMELCLNLPRLLEITIDHCSNLEELPANIL